MNMQLLRKAVAILAIAVIQSSGQASAADRAGTAPFPVGSAGITVSITPPMPDSCYAVSVQQTNTAGYSPTANCTYFNVLDKAASQFDVQHKTCNTGRPEKLKASVSLDWQLSATLIIGSACGTCGSGTLREHCGASGTCNRVCVDDSEAEGNCSSDTQCPSNLPICAGNPTCISSSSLEAGSCFRACQ